MIVRIRLGRSVSRRVRSSGEHRLALGLAALLTPAALMASVLGFWRIGPDLNWTASFAIASGIFSYWEVWIGTAAVLQFCAYVLNRYGKSGRAAS